MDYQEIILEIRDNVAWLTLNRPSALNAVSIVLAKELAVAAERCAADRNVRVIVITGSGDRAFCAGGDVLAFAADPNRVDVLIQEMTLHLHRAISTFARLQAPVIAAVNGTVAGAGLGLLACADLALAIETAKFTSAYTKIGFTPDGSSTYFLSRILGRRRTLELFLTNRVLSANEALDWGLINRVVAPEKLMEEVTALASMLASGPTLAYAGIKRLVLSSFEQTLEAQMALEAESVAAISRSDDGREGADAFRSKRGPRFRGN